MCWKGPREGCLCSGPQQPDQACLYGDISLHEVTGAGERSHLPSSQRHLPPDLIWHQAIIWTSAGLLLTLKHKEQISVKFESKHNKLNLKCYLQDSGYFVWASMCLSFFVSKLISVSGLSHLSVYCCWIVIVAWPLHCQVRSWHHVWSV